MAVRPAPAERQPRSPEGTRASAEGAAAAPAPRTRSSRRRLSPERPGRASPHLAGRAGRTGGAFLRAGGKRQPLARPKPASRTHPAYPTSKPTPGASAEEEAAQPQQSRGPRLHLSPREPVAVRGRKARAPAGRGAAPCAPQQPIRAQQVAGRGGAGL